MSFDPFADLNRASQKAAAHNGVTVEDLASTAVTVFGGGSLKFADFAEADKAPWLDVAAMALGIMDTNEDAELSLSAKALAKNLYSQFSVSCSRQPEWDEQEERIKLAWEAVGRHLLNIIDSDGRVDFEEFENKMAQWYDARCTVAA